MKIGRDPIHAGFPDVDGFIDCKVFAFHVAAPLVGCVVCTEPDGQLVIALEMNLEILA